MTSSPLPERTGVAIVGAGPTGLAAAAALAAAGQDHVIVDRLPQPLPYSRGATMQSLTLEVLEPSGLTGEMVARGLPVDKVYFSQRDRRLAVIDLGKLPTKYPYILMIPQAVTEEVLESRVERTGGKVRRGHELVGLDQDGAGVTLTFDTGWTLRADYVVGADGLESRVRELVGIDMAGGTYPMTLAVADVRLDWSPAREEQYAFAGFTGPTGRIVVTPLPDGQHRFGAVLEAGAPRPTLEGVQELLDRCGPSGVTALEMSWSSRFQAHHRHAARYRSGRVFLAGDAAHVNSPSGGHGLNLGIQDGINLARKLTDVRNGADPAMLDGYEAERRRIAAKVIGFTHRSTSLGLGRSALRRRLRPYLLGATGRIPLFSDRIALTVSELNLRE